MDVCFANDSCAKAVGSIVLEGLTHCLSCSWEIYGRTVNDPEDFVVSNSNAGETVGQSTEEPDAVGLPEDNSLLDPIGEKHALEGEIRSDGSFSGGHRPGTGFPGKSEFPAGWSDQEIKEAISDIATDPSTSWSKPDSRGFVSGTGNRGGIDILVVVDTHKGRIVTGYPPNLPRNP